MSASRSYLVLLATLCALALMPGLLGWNASVVQSESMEPNVSTGDVVLADALPPSEPIPVGRVVTFHVEGKDVVHRIVTVNEDNSIVTAGDANHDYDSWSIRREDITGRARLLVPFVGLPGMWMQRGDLAPLAGWLAVTFGALALAVPSRIRRLDPTTDSAVAHTRRSARTAWGGSGAAVAGVVVLTTALTPLAPVDATFTAHTRTAAVWKAKTYTSITVGALSGYGALAASAVRDSESNSYQSTVDGAIGTTPGTTVSGFRNKDAHSFNPDNQSARNAMAAAHALRSALQERHVTRALPPALSGTLTPGTYTSTTGALSLTGSVTLDAQGDPSARFVFRTTSALTMAQRARVVLARGAQAANVYWIVGTTATLGTSSTSNPDTGPVGTYLVAGDATMRSVLLAGRVVSFGGSVTLNGRIIPTN